jgi:hypothetical protein
MNEQVQTQTQPGHINISDDALSVFEREGVWAGLAAVAEERLKLSLKALRQTAPTDAMGILQAQLNAIFWEKTIPCIYEQFKDYVARKATQPPVNPAK